MVDDLLMKPETKTVMSRKRTRSRSEDSIISGTRIQPINVEYCLPAPFSEDPGPTQIRNDCDYTQRITLDMAKNGLAPRPVRVYADGCFDLFHSGHARVLHQAKNCFPNVYLIVGVCSDATIHKMKGRSVLNEEHRYNAVTHCRYADEVLRDAPWQYSDEFLDDNKIDFIAHDDIPYACGDVDDLYASLKQRGMFVATQRTEGISTSDIVARVVRDYDIFARRNLAKGYSAKELNLSYLKEKKFKFKNKIDKLKHTSKKMIDAIGERKDEILTRWEDTSREVVENFLLMFEPNKLRNMWHGSKEKIMKVLTPPGSPTPSTSDEVAPEPSTKRRRLH